MSDRKKHPHGAWKVAYADFVTAMMAMFLLLWLMNQDDRIKEAIVITFRNPFKPAVREPLGVIPKKIETLAGDTRKRKYDAPTAIEIEMLRRLNEDLKKLLEKDPDYDANAIELEMVPEGINIVVLDRPGKPVFESESAKFTEYGKWVFSTLGWEISRYRKFKLHLEGHTEKGHVARRPNYDPWELSADRANAARRQLLTHGVESRQIAKVSGYADTTPIEGRKPEDPLNRRVTVLLRVEVGGIGDRPFYSKP